MIYTSRTPPCAVLAPSLFVAAVVGCQTTVTVFSVIVSLVLTLSLSTCAVSAVVHAVMYKRLQRCRGELRGGKLCSTPQLSQSSCEAVLLPPSMQGEGTVSKQVQKGRGHQQGRRRRRRKEKRCRLTQPTCPLR